VAGSQERYLGVWESVAQAKRHADMRPRVTADPPGMVLSAPLRRRRDARLAHPDLVGLGVELVLDLADDLLEHVLQGDDPDRLVVLVDDQGRALAVAAQGLQQLVEQDAVGDPVQRPSQVAEAGLAVPAGGAQQVLGVDDPQGGVEATLPAVRRRKGSAVIQLEEISPVWNRVAAVGESGR
jgi:hypothetical protein